MTSTIVQASSCLNESVQRLAGWSQARRGGAKMRSLGGVNEHSEPDVNQA